MKYVCDTCKDTHRMSLNDKTVMCTKCPTPCEQCRSGPYCTETPCYCECHKAASVSGYKPGVKRPAVIKDYTPTLNRATGTEASVEALRALKLVLALHKMREDAERSGVYGAHPRIDLEVKLDPKAHEQVEKAARNLAKAMGLPGDVMSPDFQI